MSVAAAELVTQQMWTEEPASQPGRARIRARIGGLHCSLCTSTIEKALGRKPGVDKRQSKPAHRILGWHRSRLYCSNHGHFLKTRPLPAFSDYPIQKPFRWETPRTFRHSQQ